jgi:hypothetical protein
VGTQPGPVYGKNGKQHLHKRITGFNNAARYSPWIVLLDLDHDAECAPPLRSHWLPEAAPFVGTSTLFPSASSNRMTSAASI